MNAGTEEMCIRDRRTAVHGLRMDSLQLDTIFFTVKQDTARMKLQGGVINGPKNPQFVFRSTLTGLSLIHIYWVPLLS